MELKREREENENLKKLPPLLPVLVSRDSENDDYDYEEDEEDEQEEENYRGPYRRKVYERLPPPPRKRIRIIGGYGRNYIGIKRRGGLPRFRGRKIRRNFY